MHERPKVSGARAQETGSSMATRATELTFFAMQSSLAERVSGTLPIPRRSRQSEVSSDSLREEVGERVRSKWFMAERQTRNRLIRIP
jgi:hypothetical protein